MSNSNSNFGSIARSIGAVFAGLVAIFATHLGTDQVMHEMRIFPPWGEPMYDPSLNALALAYRCVFSVLGCHLAARLAPRAPMGGIGVLLSAAGFVATSDMDLGARWYPAALVVSALPCAWLGAFLYQPKALAQ